MDTHIDRYVSPFTDFGFKKLFGEEASKELLLDFLNELLYEEQGRIVSLTYLKNENLGPTELDRRAVFDIYCENERGEKFIVELQKTKQNFFKDRTVYYATFPIQQQAQRNTWNFELKAVYMVAILDFVFDEDKNQPEKYRYDIKLTDQETNKVFYDKLTFIYLEMPKFRKSVDELETRFEKWLYIIRNLGQLDRMPDKLREQIFERLFETAEIARFTREQALSYEDSLKIYRDIQNSFDTARDDGLAKGLQQGLEKGLQQGLQQGEEIGVEKGIEIGVDLGLEKVALRLIARGLPDAEIMELTGISPEALVRLRAQQG